MSLYDLERMAKDEEIETLHVKIFAVAFYNGKVYRKKLTNAHTPNYQTFPAWDLNEVLYEKKLFHWADTIDGQPKQLPPITIGDCR